MRALLVAAIVLAGCHRDDRASIHCRRLGPPEPGQGLNPLLDPSYYLCFDDRDACGKPDCEGVSSPDWWCFARGGSMKDPTAGSTSCLPSEAMCVATRTVPQDWPAASPCRPVHEVFCEGSNHTLVCAATMVDCDVRRSLAVDVLHATPSACARR